MKKLLILILLIAPFAFGADCSGSGSVISISAACTTTQNQQTIKADANGGGFTITLLSCSASRTNLTQFFQKVDSSANTVVIDGNGAQTVNGAANFTLTASRNSLRVRCDGAGDWLVETGSSASIVFTTGGISLSALAPGSDDTMLISNGTALQSKSIPACTDTGGNHLNYDDTTNTVSCGTSSGSSNLTVGSSSISSGTNTYLLYDNSGTLGEQNPATFNAGTATALAANGTNCSAGQFAQGVDASGVAEGCAAPTADVLGFYGANWFHYCQKGGGTATTWVCPGNNGTAPTGTGTLSSTNPTTIAHVTTTGSGNVAGTKFIDNAIYVGCPYNTDTSVIINIGGSIASRRVWVALTANSTLANIGAISTSTTTSAQKLVAIGYDSGGAANTANFHRFSCDGTNCSDADASIAVNTSTNYIIRFTQSGGSANYAITINGASAGTLSANLPACSAGNVVVSVTNLSAGTVRGVEIGGYSYAQPF